MSKPIFTLQHVNPADFPAIARLSNDSFLKDRHTLMKSHSENKNPYNHEETAGEPLGYYLTLPHKLQLLKAVSESGEIMGHVTWGFRGWDPTDVPTLNGKGVMVPETPVATEEAKVEESNGDSNADETVHTESEFKEDDPIKRLSDLTDDDMNHWMEVLMPKGTKCMYIVGLSVAPKFAGLGVGSALMRWGTSNADAAGVFCWVHSSESAYSFYSREGFEVVGTLDVDLDEYAVAPPPLEVGADDGKWGHYVFRYMKRMPVDKF